MGKFIDMTGQRIGNFIVVKKVSNHSCVRIKWLCLCDCGNYFECDGATLRRKEHPVCCPKCALEAKHRKNAKDLTGMIFGHLQVIGVEKDEHNHYRQLCQCDCGNVILVRPYFLLCGDIKSCGCQNPFLNKDAQKATSLKRVHDLSNQKFGRWTPIEYDPTLCKWKCQCDCGNISYVSASNLKNGDTKSCGCQRAELLREKFLVDITGLKFGILTVLSPFGKGGYKHKSKWLCQCECGEQVIAVGADLKAGRQISCGCLKSKGEFLIKQYLMQNQIFYQSQKSFDDLKGVGGKCLSYDFYLPDYQLLIEFQGVQHYSSCDFFGGEVQFEKQQEHDRRKREYASKYNYNLLEIKYNQLSKIDSILSNILSVLNTEGRVDNRPLNKYRNSLNIVESSGTIN